MNEATQFSPNKALHLLPYPKIVEQHEGVFPLYESVLVCDPFDAESLITAKRIVETSSQRSGRSPSISFKLIENKPTVSYVWDRSMPDEAYILEITEKSVTITFGTKRGRYYAAMTICQLIDDDGNLPCLHIEDNPDYQIRGIMDDISRGQTSTMDNFKKIIRFCSRMKINTYFLYIEDMIQFSANPRIGVGRGAFTKGELRELVDYAREWFVEIVPLFESLSHQPRIVTMPEYQELREREGSYSFNPTDPRTLDVMETFYSELASIFPSVHLFAGLDETNDIGTGKSKETVDKVGYARMYADFYNKLNALAKKNGKRLWIYATLAIDHPEVFDLMDKDIVAVNYTFYWPNHGNSWWDNLYTYIPIIKEKGFDQVVSPGFWNWKMLFPNCTQAYRNITSLNQAGIENGCIGTMGASWGDNGAENFREYNWYLYAAQAETAWNAHNPIEQELLAERFGQVYFGNPDIGKAIYYLGQVEHAFGGVLFHTLWNNNEKFSKGLSKEVEKCDKVETLLAEFWKLIKGKANHNAGNIQYLTFAARRTQFVVDLTRAIDGILKDEDQLTLGEEYLINNIIQRRQDTCQELIDRLRMLKEEFTALWKSTCRIEGLDFNLARYDKLMADLETFKVPAKNTEND